MENPMNVAFVLVFQKLKESGTDFLTLMMENEDNN